MNCLGCLCPNVLFSKVYKRTLESILVNYMDASHARVVTPALDGSIVRHEKIDWFSYFGWEMKDG
jgi:hypothetical protein